MSDPVPSGAATVHDQSEEAARLLVNADATPLSADDLEHADKLGSMSPKKGQAYWTWCLVKQLQSRIADLQQERRVATEELIRLRKTEVAHEKLKQASRVFRITTGICAVAMAIGGALIGQYLTATTGVWFLTADALVGLGWAMVVLPGIVQILLSIFDG